ncbi:hypothetical protein A0J61_11170 [Choanephora cucurbitarum]|uniref:TFIIS N-terminal domain-containing protein n=1 Tax=Choanephora cucurbitarum TaxID=101091 RepID=A0A1C7MV88_9FUNG|nr:hypothetical protein A0J61_11170 [Choanephora cucurbitarum]
MTGQEKGVENISYFVQTKQCGDESEILFVLCLCVSLMNSNDYIKTKAMRLVEIWKERASEV